MKDVDMIEKAFIYKNHQAVIICPKCEKSKAVDVSEQMNTNEVVTFTDQCNCGYSHDVLLERRDRHRKVTDIPGTYRQSIPGKPPVEGAMIVKEISRAGLGFEILENENTKLNIDGKLNVVFHLSDQKNALIQKEVIIKNIRGPYIVAQFLSVDLYDKPFGLYMFQ